MGKRKTQSFEYGALILIISTAISKIIGAIFKIPLNDVMGELGFGYFTSAYELFTPIYSLSMAGLPIAVSRMVAEATAEKRYRDVRAILTLTKKAFLVTGFVGFMVMLALSFPFVNLTDKTGGSIYSIIAIAPSLMFCCVMSTYRGYYEGLRNMFPTAFSDVIEASCKLLFGYTIAAVIMKYSGNVAFAAAGAIAGVTVGTVLGSLFLYLRFRIKGDGITKEELETSPEPKTQRTLLRMLIPIAVPVILTSLATNVASLIDVTMVKWQLNRVMDTSAELIRDMYANAISAYNATAKQTLTDAAMPTFLYGVRGTAFTIYNLVPTISSVLGVSALPVLASVWTKDRGNKAEIKKNIESIIKFTALIAIPAGVGMAVLSAPIMDLLYGTVPSVEIGAPMLTVFGIAAIFAGISAPMTSMLQAIGKQNIPVRNIAVGALVKIVVNFVLVGIPEINVHGAPIGTLCCFAYIFIANLLSLIKHSGVVPNIVSTLIKPLVSALLCGAAAYVVSAVLGAGTINTVLAIGVACIVYFVALIALRTFSEQDVLAFPKGEKLLKVFKKLKFIR